MQPPQQLCFHKLRPARQKIFTHVQPSGRALPAAVVRRAFQLCVSGVQTIRSKGPDVPLMLMTLGLINDNVVDGELQG